MSLLSEIKIPLHEPIYLIALLLIILFITPLFLNKLKIPAIIGLLISGALVGPNGLNLISPNLEFSLLGAFGLQYLMFLAGLEIDLIDFTKNKQRSIIFGILTFIVPWGIGFISSYYLLAMKFSAAMLIGAILASHTLVAYPVLGRLGIVNKPIITVIIGGTIITDVLALLTMEFTTDIMNKGSDLLFDLFLPLAGFTVFQLFILPYAVRYFFKHYGGELSIQYIFVLVVVMANAALAKASGLEPILGSFFSGLIINRFITRDSPLFKRIEFIGQTLFIPIFLISVGVLANFKGFVQNPNSIYALLILILAAIAGKYLASLFTGLLFRLKNYERNIAFGLSNARAASAIAIALVGFNLDIFNELFINNIVMLILFTSIISSFITQSNGKKLALKDKKPKQIHIPEERIMVPVANPSSILYLIDFAVLLKESSPDIPIYPLSIITEREEQDEKVKQNMSLIEEVLSKSPVDSKFEIVTRLDTTATNGIIKASHELFISFIIIGWHSKITPFEALFGTVLNHLIHKTNKMIMVLKTPANMQYIKRMFLFVGNFAIYEKGFELWFSKIVLLASRLKSEIHIYTENNSQSDITNRMNLKSKSLKIFIKDFNFEVPQKLPVTPNAGDLLIFVSARKNTVSYNKNTDKFIQYHSKKLDKHNMLIIYPEQ